MGVGVAVWSPAPSCSIHSDGLLMGFLSCLKTSDIVVVFCVYVNNLPREISLIPQFISQIKKKKVNGFLSIMIVYFNTTGLFCECVCVCYPSKYFTTLTQRKLYAEKTCIAYFSFWCWMKTEKVASILLFHMQKYCSSFASAAPQ